MCSRLHNQYGNLFKQLKQKKPILFCSTNENNLRHSKQDYQTNLSYIHNKTTKLTAQRVMIMLKLKNQITSTSAYTHSTHTKYKHTLKCSCMHRNISFHNPSAIDEIRKKQHYKRTYLFIRLILNIIFIIVIFFHMGNTFWTNKSHLHTPNI
jgi:hypothetical protein